MTAETTIGLRMKTKMILMGLGKKGESYDQILTRLLAVKKEGERWAK